MSISDSISVYRIYHVGTAFSLLPYYYYVRYYVAQLIMGMRRRDLHVLVKIIPSSILDARHVRSSAIGVCLKRYGGVATRRHVDSVGL